MITENKSTKEVWKPVKGYEGIYEVSNKSRIRSLDRKSYSKDRDLKGKLIEPIDAGNGYMRVNLYKKGKVSCKLFHRILAETFIPNPENKPCVNHKNEIRYDNRLNNLEWCTYSYNNRYNERAKKANETNKKKVGKYNNGNLVKVYDSIMDAGKAGYVRANIVACCKGRRKSHAGYEWDYIN